MPSSSSAVLSVIVYLSYPLIYAGVRKKPITIARYRTYCYLVNFVLHVLLATLGLFSSAANALPLLIWTFIGTMIGKKILEANGTLTN